MIFAGQKILGFIKVKKRGNTSINLSFNIIGTNADGLKLKKESFFQIINNIKPSVITVQETKFSTKGTIKIPGYQVFETVRANQHGGGLLTAAHNDINPVIITDGRENNDILTASFCG